ncbi:MAG: sodium/proline symporter, partial [Lentisphaeraceae bacterium]|nr:sodium/proline symporter [Lentisphaeraceae bacterium]
MLLLSFAFFMVMFAVIGCMSVIKSQKNTEDYLVAGRSLPPWLAGLSAVATNNSGFMFIGMIGYTYNSGLITAWFMLGWILGDYLGLKTVLQPIISASHNDDSRSLGSMMSHWIGSKPFKYFGLFAAVITVLFLSVYAAAQFKAGSKSLEAIFGLDKSITIGISAGLVLLYCFSGGIRASIWTDAAQSIVMIIGMCLLVIIGFWNSSGVSTGELPENYFQIIPGFKELAMTVLGAIGGGLMISGQPQVVSRFFTLRSAEEAKDLRFYYYLWFISFYTATVMVGVFCRLLLDTDKAFDAEMALPRLAMQFLPDAGVGLILAAIFAATISTADSLILACTAAIDEEFNKKENKSLGLTKTITLVILASSAGIALLNNDTIFSLVLDAWAMLGVAFSP